jgi:hypothetical protein
MSLLPDDSDPSDDFAATAQQEGSSNFQPVLFQGYLHKKSPKGLFGKHLWQRRFFVLEPGIGGTGGTLLYYKDKGEWAKQGEAVGIVRIDMIRDIQIPTESAHYGFRFDVLAVGGRLFELMAPSEKSCQHWVKVLREQILNRSSSVKEALKSVKDEFVAESYWKKKKAEDVKKLHSHADSNAPLPAAGNGRHSRNISRSGSRTFMTDEDDDGDARAAALAAMMDEAKSPKSNKGSASAPVSQGNTPPGPPPPIPPEEEKSSEEKAAEFLKRQYTLGAVKASGAKVLSPELVQTAVNDHGVPVEELEAHLPASQRGLARSLATGSSNPPSSSKSPSHQRQASSPPGFGGGTPSGSQLGRRPIASYGESDSDEDGDARAKKRAVAAALADSSSNSVAAAVGPGPVAASPDSVVVRVHEDQEPDDEFHGEDEPAPPPASFSPRSQKAANPAEEVPLISSILWKESPTGIFKPWQKRLFALFESSNAIHYYKSASAGFTPSNLAGTIPIHQITKVALCTSDGNIATPTSSGTKTHFNLATTEGRIYKLKSDNEELTKQWVAFIQASEPKGKLGCLFPGLVVREPVIPVGGAAAAAAALSSSVPGQQQSVGGGKLVSADPEAVMAAANHKHTRIAVQPLSPNSAANATRQINGKANGSSSGRVSALSSPVTSVPSSSASSSSSTSDPSLRGVSADEMVDDGRHSFWNFLRNKHTLFSIFYVKKKAAFPRGARASLFLLDLIMNL